MNKKTEKIQEEVKATSKKENCASACKSTAANKKNGKEEKEMKM